ncbi:NUDIX domain-containing protein [Weeksellaceae bacterium KMM 9713]|uniref:NUDIX domain-containing protein n=1 Tax=Profundicola chukchiensis TaxID=2961959 RepID=A0A9X4RTY6_9FLAO|nr:NUDIX hydrolase [Profundicola chukchiensis]MDG4945121.1 NUDIX domain-containing protein [Profundicola chukchiensis]
MPKFFQFCPKCGSSNHKFENHHRFECLDCGFVYYHNCAAAVMVIMRRDDKVLFTVRNNEPKKGKLDFPGGFVDPKESAQFAAKRELKEELDIDIDMDDLVLLDTEPNDYDFRDILYRTLDIVFEIELKDNQKINLEKSEIQEAKWLSADEINMEDIGFDSMKAVVKKYVLK